MPHLAATDLGLHCVPMSHKKDTVLLWVNCFIGYVLADCIDLENKYNNSS